ncbi:hypothetical protein AB5N19_12767 [Seiridium cardinale]
MVAIYIPNPNDTAAYTTYFAEWPSYLTVNTKPFCSSNMVPLKSQFYTNNTALVYTLSSIWKGNDESRGTTLIGSIPYQNDPIQNCSVVAVDILFGGIERKVSQIAQEPWGASLTGYVECGVETLDGLTMLNLSTTYDFNPPDTFSGATSGFPGRNQTGKSSLWWGESLLAWYSIATTDDMNAANQEFAKGLPPIYKGYVSFRRGENSTLGAEGTKSLDFFDASCYFVPFSDNGVEPAMYFCHHEGMGNSDKISNLVAANSNNGNKPLPGIWISADALAKAFYFTMLTDLGQNTQEPNVLTAPDLLAYFSDNFTAINTRKFQPSDHLKPHNIVGLANIPFDPQESGTLQLGVSPSVFATSYLCQVPRLKSIGSRIVAVLINDIVLLSTLWKLFSFITNYFLTRKDDKMMVCQACATGMILRGEEDEEKDEKKTGNSRITNTQIMEYQRVGAN